MQKVLIIPAEGESMEMPSVACVARFFGVTVSHIYKCLMEGRGLVRNNKVYFVDYVIEPPKPPVKTEVREKWSHEYKYELISQEGTVRRFANYNKMARFLHRGDGYTRKNLVDGRILESRDGDFYTLKFLGEVKA